MRLPKPPPKLKELFDQPAEELLPRLQKLQSLAVEEAVREYNDQEYLHWDALRFRTPPAGLTSKEFWYAIKMRRRAGRQLLPLSFTTADTKFSYVVPTKNLEWIHHIDKQGGGAIGVSRDSVLGDESGRYLVNSLMEEAIASSQLEGASTTRKVAKEMLRANRKPKTPAEKMILNNYRAIQAVRNLQKEDLTPELLCRLQAILTEDTLENPNAVGRFRRGDEPVHVVDSATNEILHTPPPAEELEWRIKEICNFANTVSNPFIHPVLKAAVLHFAIGYVHPFVDGNGRTARAIFYWYMLKRDYWLFEYFPISRIMVRAPSKYARAYLYTETDGGDVTYFIRYNLKAVLEAMRGFYQYLAHEEREAKEAALLLESFPGLNHRQRSLIHDALKNPGIVVTIRTHQGKHRVTYPTARADLLDLARIGLLNQGKLGKTLVFNPAEDLRKRLHLPPDATKPEKEKPAKPPIAVTRTKSADEETSPETDDQDDSKSKPVSLFD
jgi:Fic family protein